MDHFTAPLARDPRWDTPIKETAYQRRARRLNDQQMSGDRRRTRHLPLDTIYNNEVKP